PSVGYVGGDADRAARNVASTANGSAKSECANLTISPQLRTAVNHPGGGAEISAAFGMLGVYLRVRCCDRFCSPRAKLTQSAPQHIYRRTREDRLARNTHL